MYNRDPLGYYEILGVSPETNARELKIFYRDEAKRWHPDYNKDEDAIEHFQKISVAYDILHDDEKRLTYDLLACAYESSNFPQMDALSVLKDRYEVENPYVRVFSLHYVIGKIIRHNEKEERLVCSEKQAFNEIIKCSFLNWLLGWWGIKSFVANIHALTGNYKLTGNNRQDNLTLLIHNAVAYQQENKADKAVLSAVQALDYALPEQKPLLARFIQGFGIKKAPVIARWNFMKLRFAQLLVPFVLLLLVLSPLLESSLSGMRQYMNKENEITYFQKVNFNNGGETFDDIVVSKIFDIPVNVLDEDMLYHLKNDADVMYGPGEKFDTLTRLKRGHTVRVTGFTPDKQWYRIMSDDGEMGFVVEGELQKGRGNPIPENSKISAVNTEK